MKSIISHLHISRLRAIARELAATMVAVMLTTACTDDVPGGGSDINGDYIALRLTNVTGASRADGDKIPGVISLNEQLIGTATVFLFTGENEPNADAVPVFKQTIPVNKNKEDEVIIRLNSTNKEKIFPGGATKAYGYVLANLPASTAVPENVTYSMLHKLGITADFATSDPQPSFVMDGGATVSLAKDATTNIDKVTGEVLLSRVAAKISLAVNVVSEVVEGEITWKPMKDNMYTLITNGVDHTTVDPSLYTVITDDYFNTTTNATNPKHRQRMMELSTNPVDENFPYELKQPYYSYPNTWTATDYNATMTYITLVVPWEDGKGNYRRCYYMVPIVKDESELRRNVYYQTRVNVDILGSFTPDEPTEIIDASYRAINWGDAPIGVQIEDYRYLVLNQESFTMNNAATLNVPFYSSHPTEITNISVTYYLYNTTKEGNQVAVPITAAQNAASTSTLNGETINIYDANVDNSVNEITGARTLVFDHPLYQWTPYTSNNTPVELTGKLVAGNNGVVNSEYPANDLSYLLSQIDHYVRTQNEAYSRYEVDITIAHSDRKNDPNYQKKIHIVQYPGMYISADYNEGDENKYWAYIGEYSANWVTNTNMTQDNFGYVFVNARYYQASGNRRAFWLMNSLGQVDPISNSSNNGNRNNYTISISQFSTNKYKIGDPRSSNINNDLSGNSRLDGSASTADAGNWCNAARYLNNGEVTASGTTRKLRYYHPTLETDATKNTVAPRFRIASSYGEMMLTSWENCRRRCATYQERGYPAGRWRMPTRAEVEYIATLANDGKIPKLFQVGQTGNTRGIYMTAQGPYQVLLGGSLSENNVTRTSYLVRCVYDEWYWGSEPAVPEGSYEGGLKYTYVLGDQQNF